MIKMMSEKCIDFWEKVKEINGKVGNKDKDNVAFHELPWEQRFLINESYKSIRIFEGLKSIESLREENIVAYLAFELAAEKIAESVIKIFGESHFVSEPE